MYVLTQDILTYRYAPTLFGGGRRVQSGLFINRLFREYYASEGYRVTSPSVIEKREFGFISFDNVMVRHRAFTSESELCGFLKEFVPSDAYYSCAYYENPRADMDKKGWLGADLIFDIDADHIPTPCDKVHDEWVCSACNFGGKGTAPERCPVCGKEKFEVRTWPCEVCLQSAKQETIKLLDMLTQDFGFSEREIYLFFSGHRGYHVHVESEMVKTLDALTRKEIVDYFSGLGLDALFYGLDGKNWRVMPSSQVLPSGDFGWRRRLTQGLQDFILSAEEDDLRELGLRKNAIEAILRNKESILKNRLSAEAWSGVRGVGFETWRKITDHIIELQSAKIDTVVTTDIHRLIRLTGTLHGKTGFKKVEFPVSAIDDFDPFKNGVAFKGGAVKVSVSGAPVFRIGDEEFGPYKDQKVELPTAAAVLLICRGRAEVVE
jgi:DNA primase small subunit